MLLTFLLLHTLYITSYFYFCHREINNDNVTQSLSSSASDRKHHKTATVATVSQKPDEKNENSHQNENNNIDNSESAIEEMLNSAVATVDDTSTSSFKARERQITEQVKRQVRKNVYFMTCLNILCLKIKIFYNIYYLINLKLGTNMHYVYLMNEM